MLQYSVNEWESHGLNRYGQEKRKWYFQCPNCLQIQSVEQMLKEGYPPDLAYSYCMNCHYEAKKGTFGKGKIVQVNQSNKIEVFDFA
ncbi:VVA0879 family protein [Pseudalkalibacillus sp. SCS-8]|uniref:VVA0879 family protein n=1 Tax=Pseudalkalibacillus nanhaiensis TaxID=3115291 RepID=UPI0032DB2439